MYIAFLGKCSIIFRIPRLDVMICNFFTSFQKVQIFFYLLEKNHVPLQIKRRGYPNFGQFSWVWEFLWPSDVSLWPESIVRGLVVEAFELRRDSGPVGEGNGNPLQCSCLENPRDGGAWWAAVYGVAQSQTRLKWLSSSSSGPVGIRLSEMKLQNWRKIFTLLDN